MRTNKIIDNEGNKHIEVYEEHLVYNFNEEGLKKRINKLKEELNEAEELLKELQKE